TGSAQAIGPYPHPRSRNVPAALGGSTERNRTDVPMSKRSRENTPVAVVKTYGLPQICASTVRRTSAEAGSAEKKWSPTLMYLPTHLAGLQRPRRQLVVRRVTHFLQRQPVRRQHRHRRVPHLPGQYGGRPSHVPPSVTDRNHR